MRDFDPVPWLIGAAAVIVFALLISVAIADESKWRAFKFDHQCVVVGKMDGELFNTFGVSGNGQMTVGIGSTSAKTGWKCDDGVTYWK